MDMADEELIFEDPIEEEEEFEEPESPGLADYSIDTAPDEDEIALLGAIRDVPGGVVFVRGPNGKLIRHG
jgi:hypothetical protein